LEHKRHRNVGIRTGLGAAAIFVAIAVTLAVAFATPALAGPPTHLRNAALDLSGFNHACGAAVDSEGDVYVASAGESKIRVFDPAHTELNSIPNSNEPCGLAVDSHGDLFVTEKGTGKVVRYVPTVYPFVGTPTYGVAETIDASGNAKGIAVDGSTLVTNSSEVIGGDDSLYVAKGDHIDSYGNESQGVEVNASGGTFTLTFNGQTTPALPFDATHTEVQAALEALSTVGAGSVSVTTANFQATNHLVVFTHKLGLADVSPIEVDASALTGGGASHSETNGGFLASIGNSSTLTNATGVAAYTYRAGVGFDRYVFAADAAGDQVKVFSGSNTESLKLHRTIDGPKAGEDFGFGVAGAHLAVDPGNRNAQSTKCVSVAEQACTAGHLLVYDDAHAVVDEFDATGEFLDQFTTAAFADAQPTALAVDRSGGANDGTIYVTAGSGPGGGLLAFDPLPTPSRPPLPGLSHVLTSAEAVATDSAGDVYAAAGPVIHVFGPDGKEIEVGPEGKGIQAPEPPKDLAIDSAGKVYVLLTGDSTSDPTQYKVQYLTPTAYPPSAGTQYSGPTTVASGNSFLTPSSVTAIELNPANDHVFIGSYTAQMLELGSAAEGSPILNPCFGCGLGMPTPFGIAVYGANGNVYTISNDTLLVIDPDGDEVLARIRGGGSPKGVFGGSAGLAVDQSNGHVLYFNSSRNVGEEYDASGGFVSEFGDFTNLLRPSGIAIDNSGGPSNGNVYVAFDDTKGGTPDLWAFGPLSYGEAPSATTGVADGLGSGNAALHGTVDPRGFDLTQCRFEYLTDAQFITNGKTFAGATSQACAESFAEIGKGTGAVPVHADISGLDPEGRYRFRLFTENKYGPGKGEAGLFGPPLLTIKAALPVLYDEATLRAGIDPSGLQTKYHFEYGTSEGYGQSTPVAELPPGDGAVAIEAPLVGLAEGTGYHFRVVVENEAQTVQGPDQTVVTLARRPAENCPNPEFRTGLSANLPDCRAYELVTPAETRGMRPHAEGGGTAGEEFNNWLVKPRGKGAGEIVSYFLYGTLPGFEGSGRRDGYRAQRGEGAHPAAGWANELFSPTYAQIGKDGGAQQHGVASDQRYSFFGHRGVSEAFEETLPAGEFLGTPAGFEALGQGSLGTDLAAKSLFLSAGGAHAIFSSKEHLEEEAAPAGTVAVYDRAAGDASAEVISVRPDGSSFGAGEGANYVAASEDGSAVLFTAGGTLYLHRGGETTEVAAAPNAFAGVSEDGRRVFYAGAASGSAPASLFACDVETGPCAGPEAQAPTEIAPNSIFVHVSSDGSHVFFTSEEALSGGEENEAGETAEAGEHNLYAWDGTETRFVAILDPQDFVSFGENGSVNLGNWSKSISPGSTIGRANSPTRSTPDGEVFVFESHAKLTTYENEGNGEVYRYEPGAIPGEQLSCVSCDPTGSPASDDAQQLISKGDDAVVFPTTVVSNVTDDGQKVFFQSPDRLLPEDANDAEDVYEWKAQGAGSCKRPGGCIALISSGQGEDASLLYGMSADGHDVFFVTKEKLVGDDVTGSPSLYDARIDGGIPDRPEQAPCQGDACQGAGSIPPVISSPASATIKSQGNTSGEKASSCPRGQRKVRKGGKTRCVAKHQRKRHHKRRRASHNRRAHR
jgi:hypothetical protein